MRHGNIILTGAVRDNAANMQELIREGRVYHNDTIAGVVHLSPTTEIFWEDPVYRIRTASGGEKTLDTSRLWINWGDKVGEPIIVTRTHKCLPFEALCQEDKNRVMRHYSEWNIDGFDWWEGVYDNFIADMKVWGMTIRPKDIHFSGFYSQGDAAAFGVYETDMPLLLRMLGEKVPAMRLQDALAKDIISLRCEIKDYGCHYCSQDARLEIDWFDDEMSDAERAMLEEMCSHVEAELQDVCRTEAQTLFENLRMEYEYLTSEECLTKIWDANGTVFEIGTGKIFYREY